MSQILLTFLQMMVMMVWVLLLARVFLSWMPIGGGQLSAFIYQATEPMLAPIRRLLPQGSPIDWSPLVLMLIMGVLIRVMVNL